MYDRNTDLYVSKVCPWCFLCHCTKGGDVCALPEDVKFVCRAGEVDLVCQKYKS